MSKFSKSVKDLFEPTPRCFKGFFILFAIWGSAALLILLFVPFLIESNLDKDTCVG